jgi:hypothetical protein
MLEEGRVFFAIGSRTGIQEFDPFQGRELLEKQWRVCPDQFDPVGVVPSHAEMVL